MRKWPPRLWSSSEANTLGESNRGQQNQSTVPSTAISALVCRSPIRPCSPDWRICRHGLDRTNLFVWLRRFAWHFYLVYVALVE